MKIFKQGIIKYKDGIIIGALAGLVASQYIISQGIGDLSSLAEAGKGLIDNIFSRNTSAVDLAIWKLRLFFVMVGSTIGFYADMFIDRFKLKRR
ncbi:MAG: hypothetical protein GWP19_10110 [Planctomycetia bacterium]|nr:hypothetical protein [Planctomycetia bacterium]